METLEAAHLQLEAHGFHVRRRIWAPGDTLQITASRYPFNNQFPLEVGFDPLNPFRRLWIYHSEAGWRVVRSDFNVPTIHTFTDLADAVEDAIQWLQKVREES
jgi:hypothetical protein